MQVARPFSRRALLIVKKASSHWKLVFSIAGNCPVVFLSNGLSIFDISLYSALGYCFVQHPLGNTSSLAVLVNFALCEALCNHIYGATLRLSIHFNRNTTPGINMPAFTSAQIHEQVIACRSRLIRNEQ